MSRTRAVWFWIVAATQPALAIGQVSDTTPPHLMAFDFSPKEIDVTAGPQAVTVTVQMSDDLSGVKSPCLNFVSPSGGQSQFACTSRISGTTLNGTWQGTFTIPQFAESGVWRADQLRLFDNAGNESFVRTALLAALGYPTVLAVASTPDTTPPLLTSLGIAPALVDTSTSDAVVTVTLGLTDDASGVDFGTACRCSYWTLVMESPSRRQDRLIFNFGFTRTAGTDLNGTWQGTFVMPRSSEPGRWTVRSLWVQDAVRNRNEMWGDQREPLVLEAYVDVESGPADTTPPQLSTLTFAPAFINASAGPQSVTVRVRATDDLSGVDLGADHPERGPSNRYGVVFRSPSGAQTVQAGPYPSLRLTEGTPLDGVWEEQARFPQFSEVGTWRVESVQLKDVVRNDRFLRTVDLAALGQPTELVVIQPSLVTDGMVSPTGGTVSDEVFGERAEVTFPASAVSGPTSVAIDVLTSPLAIPLPSGYVGLGTHYVNIHLTPAPAFPLAAPGLTVVLPLPNPMQPGHPIELYRVDPATARLLPAIHTDGGVVFGAVDADGLTATFTGVSRLSTVVGLVSEKIAVDIDIHPGRRAAHIFSRSCATIPVAILSREAFDAVSMIDRKTLTFGRTGSETSLAFCARGARDVNHDGFLDLTCFFHTRRAAFRRGDRIGVLKGRTVGGVPIEGAEAVVVH